LPQFRHLDRFLITLFTLQLYSQALLAPLLTDYPWAQLEWRLMPHVLGVRTFEVGHPVTKFVLMETDYAAPHSVKNCNV
jgi:hypothetical protein